MGSFVLKDAWMRVGWRGVCSREREMSREASRLRAATVNHARHRPDRPPPKCGLPAMAGDDVIADFALTLQFGRFDTAVAGQRIQQPARACDPNPAASTSAQPPALSKSLDMLEDACPRSVQTPMLGLTITRRRDLSGLV